jgi:hypothetical protein
LGIRRAQCAQGPDLQITQIRLDPDPPGVGQSYNVHVEIINDGQRTNQDSWAHLFINRAPTGDPDVQAFAQTSALQLNGGNSIEAHFTITQGYATAGWHTLSVRIDAQNDIAEACGGEGNNESALSFNIQQVYTPTPTNTPFPAPQILFFDPETASVAYGNSVTLQWQVSGQAVTVFLDDELMPMVNTHTIYPTEDHVYILRAENPGGVVQATCRVTMVEPTSTPTITPTPCNLPTIHEFGAWPSSITRGERVTIFWDVSGAREVFLNGGGVEGVSSRTYTLDSTTEFVLMARNECGQISDTLTVQARYPTPTYTVPPTRTPIPTSTRVPTRTPTRTPTRNVLATPTATLGQGTPTHTATPTSTSSAFESPVGPGTPTRTATLTATATPSPSAPDETTGSTPTAAATPTDTPTQPATQPAATDTPASATPMPPTATVNSPVVAPTLSLAPTRAPDVGATEGTATWTPAPAPATPTAMAGSAGGSIRAYLCPLSVLLAFAIGVLVLSIVMPRIQERRQGLETLQHAVSGYGVPPTDEQGSGSRPEGPAPPEGTP